MSDFDALVKAFEPPVKFGKRMPYVLFGHYPNNWCANQDPTKPHVLKKEPALTYLLLDGCHGTPASIDHYVKKGWKVLGYWLPQGMKSPATYGPGGVEVEGKPGELESHIQMLMGVNATADAELKKMDEKVKKYEAEIEALKNANTTPGHSKRSA